MSGEIQALTRNCIKNFILRIDLNGDMPVDEITRCLKDDFIRMETRKVAGFTMNLDTRGLQHIPAVSREESEEFYFVKSETNVMSILPKQNAVIINAKSYISNEEYKSTIDKLAQVCSQAEARRIGLRYVNVFACAKQCSISSVFNTQFAAALRGLMKSTMVNRAICVQSRKTSDDYICNVQFGLPNEGYPDIIRKYELLLDIDSFVVGGVRGGDWVSVVSGLNHAAYDVFREIVTTRKIEEMK